MRADSGKIETALQDLVERDLAAWPQMPARLLLVLAPERGIDVEAAAGVADRETGESLRPGSRFRIASVTKSFVGAATLRLVEEGELSLTSRLDELLPGDYLDVLRHGGYDTGAITLRHLLAHTSGIYDFAASAYDPTIPDSFDDAIAKDPMHRWTRMEQIEFAMTHGKPYGPPGAFFAYSDTNACLVGEILERATRLGMGEAMRTLIDYDRLGLTSTWLESVEPEPENPPQLSHQYEADVDVAGIDPSVDLYGGGGLMSTCRDIALFFRSLLRAAVFAKPETLATMLTTSEGVPLSPETGLEDSPSVAGLYIFKAELDGATWWGHDGYWGTTAFTCPERDVTIVAGHQQAKMPKEFERADIIERASGLIG
ncbi:MAG: serine hydrolase domain-containing protein [Actinomycetota bacterium]